MKHNESAQSLEQLELNRLLLDEVKPVQPMLPTQQTITNRLQARVAQSIADHAQLVTVREKKGTWQHLTQGIRLKLLWNGSAGNSVLIEFAPGASLPVHRHTWLEEGIVLEGGLQIGNLELEKFDYHASPANSRHSRIQSRQGALAYLRGTSLGNPTAVLRELVTGLLPMQQALCKTIHANEGDWHELQPGVFKKELFSDGVLASSFYRLEPGASCEGHVHPQNEECLVLSGEVFLGDILLCANDYQFAPKESFHGEVYTDVGTLLYVRGAA